jgi:hypothetical protein
LGKGLNVSLRRWLTDSGERGTIMLILVKSWDFWNPWPEWYYEYSYRVTGVWWVPVLYSPPHILRDSSGTPQTPQGLLRDFSKSLQISQKVLRKSLEKCKDSLRTPQGLLRDLSEIDKDPTRTPQGLLKDFIQI